jgi:flagellar biosynthesis/type III secretory pathway protein FliH
MRHATVPLLKQALREMRQYYPDNKQFGDHLVRFNTIMQRSTTMEEPDKQEMEEELKMVYKIDQFIDGNTHVEERVERGIAQGIAQGRTEGRAEGMQRLILTAIKDRFPTVVAQAQPQIERVQDTDALEMLFRQLTTATTEREVRRILHIQESQ